MKNWNGNLASTVDKLGWGLFLILIGGLFFADNQGWLKGHGWLYFAIGLGSIFILGGVVRYTLVRDNLWKAAGGMVAGLALIYIGLAFLFGFGDWWPLALVPIGIGYLARGLWGINHHPYTPQSQNTKGGISI
jgi:hypothetical protein